MCTLFSAGNGQMTAQVPSQINLRFLLPSMLRDLIARQPNTPVWGTILFPPRQQISELSKIQLTTLPDDSGQPAIFSSKIDLRNRGVSRDSNTKMFWILTDSHLHYLNRFNSDCSDNDLAKTWRFCKRCLWPAHFTTVNYCCICSILVPGRSIRLARLTG